ncbi:hypothetical protein A3F00_05245 [Candidatus Daviesbacteria bacterium RIFCSPHIGHO2_12_FULL_37_11]|uniref:histidine kinase n=1 Tax=Candidatus Daviesbacteria bacterium RIFCSPHIGHO2_12_FULL_37_11 TaxID=1797777 RepID=A0A1F5KAG9_9BACT|nr:MAG: hypothetical protein A2769_00805 [Candidatus Daviesbacteria bacterium RIFCSPHIGHO2_01_FULL_37_27]OGE37784.1 MAG: hypothetical protein A3F00_05245 [Candidatus Daviesbacteria bacterium RIFCSPHIGHO2_12_FULL_37_11]
MLSALKNLFSNPHSDEIKAEQEKIVQTQKALQDEKLKFEQQKLQETTQLTLEKNKLSIALSGITDAIIAVDMQKNITIFNKAAEILTGLTQSEVLGKPIDSMLKIYDKANELTFLHYCPINIQSTGIVYKKEGLKVIGKKTSFVNLISSKIPEGQNANLGCILSLHDVSSSKQLESMKMDFISMAAHELRTPITSIKGYLSVYMQENRPNLNADQLSLLQSIEQAVTQLTTLVENLLSAAKIDRGVLNVSFENLDWQKFVSEAVSNFESRAKEKGISLEFIPYEAAVPQVKVDKVRIGEVLSNLISNSINYTEPGGKIRVWAQYIESNIITSIADTGKGLPPEAIPQLFNKFFRVTNALEGGTKGTGLGLYIAKSIIEMHHGKIWVESGGLGKGATFSFSLPL